MIDTTYITGLLDNNPVVLRNLYATYAGRIEALVVQRGGTTHDARDVMQDALLIIYRKAQAPDFELTSSFYTYLYGICRFVWLKKRAKKNQNTVTLDAVDGYSSDDELEQAYTERERQQVFTDSLAQLGETCQRILRLFFARTPMVEIAELLELENEHTARTRKYRCTKALEKRMKADPRYAELQQTPKHT